MCSPPEYSIVSLHKIERKKEDDKINRRSKTLTAYAFLYETVLLFSILHQFHKLTAGLDNYQFALPNLPGIIYDS